MCVCVCVRMGGGLCVRVSVCVWVGEGVYVCACAYGWGRVCMCVRVCVWVGEGVLTCFSLVIATKNLFSTYDSDNDGFLSWAGTFTCRTIHYFDH